MSAYVLGYVPINTSWCLSLRGPRPESAAPAGQPGIGRFAFHSAPVVLGPTATPRTVRGLRAARRAVGRTPADYALVFRSNRGTRISYDAVHYQWSKLCAAAGLLDGTGAPRYTPHQLRHTRGAS